MKLTNTHPGPFRRRQLLGAAGLALLSPVLGTSLARAASSGSAPADPLTRTLPAPTGRHPVGTATVRLVDHARRDPWLDNGSARELMLTLWYPAVPTPGAEPARQLSPGVAAQWQPTAQSAFTLAPNALDWAATRTHAVPGAPVRHGDGDRDGRLPVLLYSPGHNMPRGLGTVLATELASRGYTVIALDHTYETIAVEFPGDRVESMLAAVDQATLPALMGVRVTDVRFVLDQFARLAAGEDGRAAAQLPPGLAGRLSSRAIGMFGHSLGATTAQAMHDDPRILAGADLDGAVRFGPGPNGEVGSVVEEGLDCPFLLLDSALGNHTSPALTDMWQHLRGWHRNFQLTTAGHYSYTDLQALLPPLAAAGRLPANTLTDNVGTVDPCRSLRAQSACLAAFFDLHLRHRTDHGLLDGPSADYTEMSFVA